jgi:glyoxylase-like metal-dependent hydrolase (beta-lactamase superfamily II)
MKIIPLKKNPRIYSCNSYLILGAWNQLQDVNTLIDPGTDGHVVEEIEQLSTGCGKRGVEQVILTHEHFDHAGGVSAIKQRYGCRVYAFKALGGVDEVLLDGQKLHVGDRYLDVIHAPVHSNDSICLYCAEEGVLFSGDTPLSIMKSGGSFCQVYLDLLVRFSRLRIDAVYSGHDEPLWGDASEIIRRSLANVKRSMGGASGLNPLAVDAPGTITGKNGPYPCIEDKSEKEDIQNV